jgi:hypothetical protein
MTKKNRTRADAERELAQAVEDTITQERVRMILDDPQTPKRIKRRVGQLVRDLNENTNAFQNLTDPDLAFATCGDAISAYRAMKESHYLHAEATRNLDALTKYTAQYSPEEYELAQRIQTLYAAEKERSGNGAHLLATFADEVTQGGSDGLVLDPDSEFFVPVFVQAARDVGRRNEDYIALKRLVERAEAGESLAEIEAERERKCDERSAELQRERLNAPEPKNKRSDAWRYWKLRQIEHAFENRENDQQAYEQASAFVRELVEGLYNSPDFWNMTFIAPMLAHFIIARQKLDGQKLRAKRAGSKGIKTRTARKESAAAK